jgi:hypothetical protein
MHARKAAGTFLVHFSHSRSQGRTATIQHGYVNSILEVTLRLSNNSFYYDYSRIFFSVCIAVFKVIVIEEDCLSNPSAC